MPYASAKQANLMRAVAHSPSFAKKVGIPQSVGQKFEAHKAKGGEIMASKKLFGGKESYAEELKEAKAIKSGRITPQEYAREERKEERSMKTKKMGMGGALRNMPAPTRADRIRAAMGPAPMRGQPMMAKGGFAVSKMGSVKTAAPSRDGMATKGKTKGTQVKMAGNKGMKYGGKC